MNKPFSKKLTIIILIVLALLTAVLAFGLLILSQQDNLSWDTVIRHKESIVENEEIDTSDWLVYRNEEYGWEMKYPKTFELASVSEAGGFIPFDSLITSSIYVIRSDSKEVIFSVDVRGNETLTSTWVAMQSDALKPAILQPSPIPVVIAGVSGYKIAKDTIAITTDFPQGTKYVSNQYFLQKNGGPIFNLVIPGDLGGQILSTFKFTK